MFALLVLSLSKYATKSVFEAMTIREGLLSIFSLSVWLVLVESDCLEVVNLMNMVSSDLSEISFFINETKSDGTMFPLTILFD